MMREILLQPRASSLMQSMRDIGYSLETAVADLIDNSITAQAANIQLHFEMKETGEASFAILDDGTGMSEAQLVEAMRPGSLNPRESRDENDLGRFGLGLKTASFSQCKSLTVISRAGANIVAIRWDLDLIANRDEWVATFLSPKDIEELPFSEKLGERGTCVLWQKLDRFLESGISDRTKKSAYDKLLVVENHLALVFHRYLSGEYRRRKINIFINGHLVEPFDPFCISNKATQALREEIVRINNHEVRIQPYILPHHSKLSGKELDFYRTRSDFITNQGAYIYRTGRLMAWGDWYRLIPKTEATKLARVQIDFPNSLDEKWTIDIKKSRAHPPPEVREKLRQIIERITDLSKRVHLGRGSRLFDAIEYPLWQREVERNGIRYCLNRKHPLIMSMREQIDLAHKRSFDTVLSTIEHSLPVSGIYADYANSPQLFEEKAEISYQEIRSNIDDLYSIMVSTGTVNKNDFGKIVFSLKMFSENRSVVERILEELM